jgi:hypothetical protein
MIAPMKAEPYGCIGEKPATIMIHLQFRAWRYHSASARQSAAGSEQRVLE